MAKASRHSESVEYLSVTKSSSRRKFLTQSAAVAGGLAGILSSGIAPAIGQERELKMMTWSHFVPESDNELERQFEEFGKQAGVKVRMDRVAHLQLPAVLAGEVQGQKGHDIVNVSNANPHLYSDHLEDIGEIYEKVGAAGGGWTTATMGKGREGQQTAMPWYFISFPLVVRSDLIAGIGEDMPNTWDDVRRIGAKLKKQGHPVGIQLAHSADSNFILRGILWSHGAKLVEDDSETIAINSKESLEAFKFIKALYQEAMDEEVLAWDDRNNNVCIVSGKCSMILNPISAYRSAVRENVKLPGTDLPIHPNITHVIPPEGPGGRHMAASYVGIGVWKFAQNKELAKEFLEYHFSQAQQEKHLLASKGYNQPVLANHAFHPLYATSSKYYFAPFIGWYTHAMGYPGVPTAACQTVVDQYILPDAAALCATDRLSPEEALKKAEAQITRIYRRYKKT